MKSSSKLPPLNIYQIYVASGRRLGFHVRRTSWKPGRYAKVVGIEFVRGGQIIKGKPPGLNRPKNPAEHAEGDEIRELMLVRLEADWLIGGIVEIDSGGKCDWEQVVP